MRNAICVIMLSVIVAITAPLGAAAGSSGHHADPTAVTSHCDACPDVTVAAHDDQNALHCVGLAGCGPVALLTVAGVFVLEARLVAIALPSVPQTWSSITSWHDLPPPRT